MEQKTVTTRFDLDVIAKMKELPKLYKEMNGYSPSVTRILNELIIEKHNQLTNEVEARRVAKDATK